MSHRRILCCALTLLFSLALASCAGGASGASSAAAPTATSSLPAVLPPGIIMYLHVAITARAPHGTYSFAVSVTADGAQMPFTSSASMLLAPVAHVWNGQACTASSMLSQIPPATNPPTPYICPVS